MICVSKLFRNKDGQGVAERVKRGRGSPVHGAERSGAQWWDHALKKKLPKQGGRAATSEAEGPI
jgi:hypothetical protein